MRYTNQMIAITRDKVIKTEQRIQRQQRRAEKPGTPLRRSEPPDLLPEHDFAVRLWAELAIIEQGNVGIAWHLANGE